VPTLQQLEKKERRLIPQPEEPTGEIAIIGALAERIATLEVRINALETILGDHQAGAIERQREIDQLEATGRKLRWAQRLRRTP
jgi:hypothetical protein